MTLTLPDPIRAYFAAEKAGGNAVARCFRSDAVVKDEGRTHRGRRAIAAWKTEATERFCYTSEPFDVTAENGTYVVSSRVSGDFPGSPIDLHLAFRLAGDEIACLEITP